MPSIGWSEMLMLAVVAIVVVGPKELPRLMRVVGYWIGKARAAAREFQQAFDEMARESEIDEMRQKMETLRRKSILPDIEDEDEVAEAARRASDDDENRTVSAGNGTDNTPSSDDEETAEEPESRPVPSH